MSIITPELLTDLLRGALLPVAGAVGQSAVMIGGEWIKLWQMENAVSVGQKAVEFLKKRGISSKEQLRDITTKFGILYLEGASVEDQPELQELWAKLLANAVDPNFPAEKLSNAFFDVIKGLDPLDAKILNYWNDVRLKSDTLNNRNKEKKENLYYGHETIKALAISKEDYSVSAHNLMRLQCITVATEPMEINPDTHLESMRLVADEYLVVLTSFGIRFLEACVA